MWVDDNIIGDSRSCADHDADGTYTGTLAQECEATNGDEQCRKLNRMICYFNWGLDAVIDSVAGTFYDGSANCAGASSASDNETSESDYVGSSSTLADKCGTFSSARSGCSKLNKMICTLNWGMAKMDNLIIGKANKFLLPFTKKIFVSYNDLEGISDKYSNKVFQIGNLVREEIINLDISNTCICCHQGIGQVPF